MADLQHLEVLKRGRNAWNRFVNEFHETPEAHTTDASPPYRRVDLTGADLRVRDFSGFVFTDVDLSGAELRGSLMRDVHCDSASFADADLRDADLHDARLRDTDLSRADCSRASLTGVIFDRCIARDANFEKAALFDATFRNVELGNTRMARADMGHTSWTSCDLRGAQGLESIRHSSPSSLGIDTLLLSEGAIPEVFLRGCGVPDSVIAYARSLVLSQRPIDWYSCFLSHSSKDRGFCDRLYADLQAAGVRCWLSYEELTVGEPFRDAIEAAIRAHDKLVVVLSKDAVESPWVETEVESALARERRDRSRVVFPLRLDDAVLETAKAWPQHVQQSRHIADFTGWKDHDTYRRAFQRLLRDLKSTPEKPA